MFEFFKIGYFEIFEISTYANDSRFMDACVRIVIMFGLTNNLF